MGSTARSSAPGGAGPAWGDVWDVDFGVPAGHEQGRRRPALVVSSDWFNRTRAGLVVVCPLTRRLRPLGTRVRIDPPEGGLDQPSDVMVEHVRSISVDRLADTRRGVVDDDTMEETVKRLKVLLLLGRRL